MVNVLYILSRIRTCYNWNRKPYIVQNVFQTLSKVTCALKGKMKKRDSEWEFSFPYKDKLIIDSYGCYKLIIMFDVRCVHINAVMTTTIFFFFCCTFGFFSILLTKTTTRAAGKKFYRNGNGHCSVSDLPIAYKIFFLRKLRGCQHYS